MWKEMFEAGVGVGLMVLGYGLVLVAGVAVISGVIFLGATIWDRLFE